MVRYKRFGFLALNVTDLDKSFDFYSKVVGLKEVPSDTPGYKFVRCSEKHHDIALFQSDKPGIKRIGFEVESVGELDKLRQVLDQHGIPHSEIPDEDQRIMHISAGVRTLEPVTQCTIDFYPTMEQIDEPYVPPLAKIQRLGHLVLKSADYNATVKFFTEVLNFKISDSIKDRVTFLRCFPNPFHHSLGVGNGNGKSGFHHVNFMCTDVDDIGQNYWRLQKLNVPIVNGPGRHLPSGSMFLYYLDPDGMTVEYSFGMEEFPEHDPREPRYLEPVPESNDLWFSPIDPRKAAVGNIEPSELARLVSQ
ncbi:MAG: VOC family protein [Janthinobacterium lividum]